MIRQSIAIITISFKEFFAYRGNLLFEMLSSLVTPALSVALWYSLFQISGETTIKGYTLSEMMAYLLCVAFVESILLMQNQGMKQMDDIHNGVLNAYLLKPFHPYVYWFSYDVARKMMTALIAVCTVGVVAAFCSIWIHFPFTLGHVLIAVAMILLAAPLHFLLFSFVVLFTFWLGRTWGLTFLLRVIMGVATGAMIPLSFFSDSVRQLFLVLPFQFFGYVPVQIFLGRYTSADIASAFGLLCVWIIVLGVACGYVYKKGVKSYGAYGG